MTPEQFCYWLQGRAELVEGPPSAEEWASIREHLQKVFDKQTTIAPTTFPDSYPTPPVDWNKPIC